MINLLGTEKKIPTNGKKEIMSSIIKQKVNEPFSDAFGTNFPL